MTNTELISQGVQTRQMVFNFICEFWLKHNYSPTLRDIVENTSVKSTSHASSIVQRLRDDGLITFDKTSSRSIVVVGMSIVIPNHLLFHE